MVAPFAKVSDPTSIAKSPEVPGPSLETLNVAPLSSASWGVAILSWPPVPGPALVTALITLMRVEGDRLRSGDHHVSPRSSRSHQRYWLCSRSRRRC